MTGFQAWWKLSLEVQDSEKSQDHLCCPEQQKTLETWLKLHNAIDAATVKVVETEIEEQRDMLQRLLDIMLFLPKQNLVYHGHKEDESSQKKGNFF